MTEKSIVLIKGSTGGRGEAGKSKLYQIVQKGTTVRFSWGMAEKPARQHKVVQCVSEAHAARVVNEQRLAKQGRGYQVAYSV